MVTVINVTLGAKTQLWCAVIVFILAMVMEVAALNGPNVCMVKQKYNITKRVKYRAPMSVRTYEWCMSLPPRCSKWSTEMRDLTRLETEERTAEVAVCCPGYKMKDVSCVPICPNGRTGQGCSQDCPQYKWGPNCVHDCQPCSDHGSCSPITGECSCQEGWQGESCESRIFPTTSTTTSTTARVEELLTKIPATNPILSTTSTTLSTARIALVETASSSALNRTTLEITSSTSPATLLETTKSNTTNAFKEIITASRTTQQSNSSPKNSASNESILKTSETTLFENTTMKKRPLTTPASSTLTNVEVSTTKAPITTTTSLTNSKESTTTKTTSTEIPISPAITKHGLSTEPKTQTKVITEKAYEKSATTRTTESYQLTTDYNNVTMEATEVFKAIKPTTKILTASAIYNRTEPPHDTRTYVSEVHVEIKTTPIKIVKSNEFSNTAIPQKTTAVSVFTETPIITPAHVITTAEGTTKLETTKRPDATIRYFPTTVKFKPKEIWIRPAQKGESFNEKKTNHDLHLRHRVATNKEPTPNTTPKTIIVSIIPTSVSYTTYKKFALTTASLLSQTMNMTLRSYNKSTEQGFTKPMSVVTTTLSTPTSKFSTTPKLTVENATTSSISEIINSSKSDSHLYKVAKAISSLSNTGMTWKDKTVSLNGTNSMTIVNQNLNSSNSITPTVSSTNLISTSHKPSVTLSDITLIDTTKHIERVTKHPFIKIVTVQPRNATIITVSGKNNDTVKIDQTVLTDKTNATKTKAKTNKITTESPDYEETFHILTEPEHITAVMEGKGKERTSVDLISVISIAGGIMMAVITVAVIIVMVERCRRPRYDDVRKMNDIHMQVMIDNNDVPPPYVRSIFHTPLPDPPTSDKCHYQPISTLDRNLKQFMRPVVVQTISPIMLENFRGILECHYDHLPRRSHDFEARQKHYSKPPSIDDLDELTHLRPCSIAESTIDALKCEANIDILDSTTSEPLYAEIPCWRPPSEHAIEIMNLNGEAVTEL